MSSRPIRSRHKANRDFVIKPTCEGLSFHTHLTDFRIPDTRWNQSRHSASLLSDWTEREDEVTGILILIFWLNLSGHKTCVNVQKRGSRRLDQPWQAAKECQESKTETLSDPWCNIMIYRQCRHKIGHWRHWSTQGKRSCWACLKWFIHRLECLLVKIPKRSH